MIFLLKGKNKKMRRTLTKEEKEREIFTLKFLSNCYQIREDVKEYYRQNRRIK